MDTQTEGVVWFGVYTGTGTLVAVCADREEANAWIEAAPASLPDLVARVYNATRGAS